MVSGNYFTMLGVKPAIGRVFNSQEDDQQYQGHPVVVLSYDYWESRFARDPDVVGKKILVNNYPMTIVGVSQAGLRRHRSGAVAADSRADPDEAGDGARVGLAAHGRSPHALGPGVRAAEAGLHGRDRRKGPLQGLFTQIRQYEMTLPAAKDWSPYSREQFMKGQMHVESARRWATRASATTSRRRWSC